MALLANIPITTAVTALVTSVFQLSGDNPESILIQGNFTYGSGGTTADAWVQTSVDDPATWTDICNFHFTTSSARFLFNLSALTPVTTEYTPTDGTLSANTSKDGILGMFLRVKYTTTGTYAGGTILQVNATTRNVIQTPPYNLNM